MKLIHTSDWHFGRSQGTGSYAEDQRYFLEELYRLIEKEGVEAYEKYQIEHEHEILKPGASFQLIKALLRLNEAPSMEESVEVLIASRNSANTSKQDNIFFIAFPPHIVPKHCSKQC